MGKHRAVLGTVLVAVLSVVAVAGCGDDGDASSGASSGNRARADVGIVTSVSLKSSYGKALLGGIDRTRKELGNKVDVAEQVQPSAFASTLADFATRGHKLVLLDGADFQEAALKTAPKFPGTMFVVVNGFQPAEPNVAAVDFEFEQSGFLAGVVAGLTTKSGNVGYVGGVEIPPLQRLLEGFKQGVKQVNPQAQVTVSYTGSWTDAGKAEQVAQAQVSKGIDVIWTIAANANAGVYKAAQDKHVGVVAYGADDSANAPQSIITTATVDYGKVIFDLAREFDEGKLKPTLTTMGFDQGVLDLAPFGSFVDKSVEEQATALAAKAKAGEIKVERVKTSG